MVGKFNTETQFARNVVIELNFRILTKGHDAILTAYQKTLNQAKTKPPFTVPL